MKRTIAYYPYGSVIADLGTGTTGQPFKFGDKELVTEQQSCGYSKLYKCDIEIV